MGQKHVDVTMIYGSAAPSAGRSIVAAAEIVKRGLRLQREKTHRSAERQTSCNSDSCVAPALGGSGLFQTDALGRVGLAPICPPKANVTGISGARCVSASLIQYSTTAYGVATRLANGSGRLQFFASCQQWRVPPPGTVRRLIDGSTGFWCPTKTPSGCWTNLHVDSSICSASRSIANTPHGQGGAAKQRHFPSDACAVQGSGRGPAARISTCKALSTTRLVFLMAVVVR
jgi:hypothetical protein